MDKKDTLLNVKNRIAKDTLIYLLGKGVEGIIGILTLSIYTNFFLPEIYNDYNLITVSINIATVILMGWLVQSGIRYVNMYSSKGKKALFMSTAFRIWLALNSGVYLLCIASYFFIGAGKYNTTGNLKYYVLAAALMFTGYSTTQILTGYLAALRYIRLNLVLSVFSAAAKLILTVIGVKTMHLGSSTPAAAIISSIIIDFIVITIIAFRLKLHALVNIKAFSRVIFKKTYKYGIPIAGMGFAMSILNLSDRFVINFSLGNVKGPVANGIYAANYSLASAVFTILMIGMMRGVYPNILKAWKQNDKELSMALITQGIRNYILIGMPCVFGLSLLSAMISGLFLDPAYHPGSSVIIWVSAGMFFLGLTEYSNKPWELTVRTVPPLVNSIISGVFNITVNLIFIPVYGYKTAAISTALSYFLYFTLSITRSRKALNFKLPVKPIIKITASCLSMGLTVLFLEKLLTKLHFNGIVTVFVTVVCGAITYAVVLILTGEVKNEVAQISRRLNLSAK